MLKAFDHVNVRTANLGWMVAWYEDVLGLKRGARPPFDFNGAWLYLGDQALVHLVEVVTKPAATDPRLEHAAFSADGLGDFLAHLRARDVPYRIGTLPEFGTIQVNIWDPDGNHLHVDFPAGESDALRNLSSST